MTPSLTARSAEGIPIFSTAIWSSAWRAVAAACRSCTPATWMERLPQVGPWSGVSAVSPSISLIFSTRTSSSSATICGSAIRMPVPRSTLPVYIVTVPFLWTARKLSTWSSATGFVWPPIWAGVSRARLKPTMRAPVPIRNSRRVVSSVAMSGPLSHQARGPLDGGDDPLVRPAATEVVLERVSDLALGGVALLGGEEGCGLHHHAVDAVAALGGLLLDEGLLDRVRLLGGAQPLEGDDLGRADLADRDAAGARRLAVHQHGARSALRQPASELGPVQLQVVAEHVEQRGVGFDVQAVGFAVDRERDHRPSSRGNGSSTGATLGRNRSGCQCALRRVRASRRPPGRATCTRPFDRCPGRRPLTHFDA